MRGVRVHEVMVDVHRVNLDRAEILELSTKVDVMVADGFARF